MILFVPVLAWWAVTIVNDRPPRLIEAHPTARLMSLQELKAAAEVIAIVTPTGERVVHWNSSDNGEWQGQTPDGREAMIVRDDVLRVVAAIKGTSVGDLFTVRGVGGIVREVEYRYEGQTEWRSGDQYLVFLRRDLTPTRDGFERMWTVVDIGQGVLPQSGAAFMNDHGLAVPVEGVSAALRND